MSLETDLAQATSEIKQEVQTGAEQLTEAAARAISGAHDMAISNIDEMITKLQSIKSSIAARRDEAVAKLKDFVTAVDQGLQGIKALDQQVGKVLKDHLGTPSI